MWGHLGGELFLGGGDNVKQKLKMMAGDNEWELAADPECCVCKKKIGVGDKILAYCSDVIDDVPKIDTYCEKCAVEFGPTNPDPSKIVGPARGL